MANELGNILPTSFGGNAAGGAYVSRPAPPRDRPGRPRLDQVELTEPRRAALRLLRERVLENTRLLLDLPVRLRRRAFAELPSDRADAFVGRLLSDQNWLAARRAGTWPADRIRQATQDGMVQGVAETLEILHEVDELDAGSWGLVCAVLEEFHRKVEGGLAEAGG